MQRRVSVESSADALLGAERHAPGSRLGSVCTTSQALAPWQSHLLARARCPVLWLRVHHTAVSEARAGQLPAVTRAQLFGLSDGALASIRRLGLDAAETRRSSSSAQHASTRAPQTPAAERADQFGARSMMSSFQTERATVPVKTVAERPCRPCASRCAGSRHIFVQQNAIYLSCGGRFETVLLTPMTKIHRRDVARTTVRSRQPPPCQLQVVIILR